VKAPTDERSVSLTGDRSSGAATGIVVGAQLLGVGSAEAIAKEDRHGEQASLSPGEAQVEDEGAW
jgi:hypothetical protein